MKPIQVDSPRALIGLFFFGCSLLLGQVQALESASSSSRLTPLAKKHESSQLKSVVLEQYSRLGPLQPWQERLWQEEVLPHHLRFIKDYRSLPSGIQAEVDLEGIRNFLKFYAPAPLMKKPESLPQMEVFLDTQTPCERCTQALPQIKEYVLATLESRGLRPAWVSARDLGLEGPLDPGAESVESRLTQRAQAKKDFGALVVSWNPAPEEEIDTAHADEKRYWVEIHLSLPGTPSIYRKKEILDNESFFVTVNRLMVDVFTDLGGQLSHSFYEDLNSQEVLILIQGERDYTQYTLMKTQLAEALKPYGSLEDRMLSKKELVFAVSTQTQVSEIQRAVLESKVRWDAPRQFQVSVSQELPGGGVQLDHSK